MHNDSNGELVAAPEQVGSGEPSAWREPTLLRIPHFDDERGSLLVVEGGPQLPFRPERFYCIRNATPQARRGGHAHWKEQEIILALAGAFTVAADDGVERVEYRLDRPDVALFLPRRVWHELYDFSPNAICAVFASEPLYDKEDYCRDYQEFLALLAGKG